MLKKKRFFADDDIRSSVYYYSIKIQFFVFRETRTRTRSGCSIKCQNSFCKKRNKTFFALRGPDKKWKCISDGFQTVCCGLLRNKMLCFLLVFVKWFSLKNVRSKLQVHQFELFIELVFTRLMIKTVAELLNQKQDVKCNI